MKVTVAQRFWAKVAIDPSGCWLWQGAIKSDGYGLFKADKQVAVHRWAWEQRNGPVPVGLELDHLCNVRNCVNPAHLEPVTHAENQRRAAERNTHCRRGHERTPANTYVSPAGVRTCRPCKRLIDVVGKQRRRAMTTAGLGDGEVPSPAA